MEVSESGAAGEPSELERVRAERDKLHRELGDLRAWLTLKLKIAKRSPGPQGFTVLSVPSDREIIARIEQLMRDAGDGERPPDGG